MKKCHILLIAAALLVLVGSPAWSVEAPQVLGLLEIRGLDNLAASAFELSKATAQPVAREAVSLLLYNVLGTMPGMGISPNGTLRTLLLEDGPDKGSGVLLLPVENEGQDYLTNLGQAGWESASETADGILHFIAPDGAGTPWKDVYFQKAGAILVAGRTAADVRKGAAAMPGLPPILPVEGDAAFQIRPAALVKAFGSQIEEQFNKALQSPEAPPEAAAMGTLYIRAYLAAARQVDELVVGLNVADGQLKFHSRVAPVAGTTFTAWLGTLKTPDPTAATIANHPDALFAEALNLGDLDLLAPVYFRYMDALMAAMPGQPGADQMKTYIDSARTYWDRMAGDFSILLLPPTAEQPLRLAEYLSLKDATGLRELNRQLIQDANEMMKSMLATNGQPPPFQIDLAFGEPREHRGVAIDTLSYSVTLGNEMAPLWPQAIPTRFTLEIAWFSDGLLAVMGDAALTDSLVDRALEGASAPLAERPAWKAAYPDPDENPIDFTHFALFDTLRAYLELMDNLNGSSLAANIPDGPGNIEATSYVALGGFMTRVRLNLADIGAVARKIQEAQEKARSEMLKQMDWEGEMAIEDEPGALDDPEMEPWDPDAADTEDSANPGADAPVAPAPKAPVLPAAPAAPAETE